MNGCGATKFIIFGLSFEPLNTTSCVTAEKSGGNVKSVSYLFGTQK